MADETNPRAVVWVDGTGKDFHVDIKVGPFKLSGDAGPEYDGDDIAPDPYDFLLTSLGTCTAMYISYFARQSEMPIEHVRVKLTRRSMYFSDCADCYQKEGNVQELTREIELSGPLSEEQRQTLFDAALHCPVSQILTHEIKIRTHLVSGLEAQAVSATAGAPA